MSRSQSGRQCRGEMDRSGRFPPGQGVDRPRPGDFILVHGNSWRSRVISGYELLRARTRVERQAARWNHAAIIVGTNGAIVEAGTAGVIRQHVEKYRDFDYRYVTVQAPRPTPASGSVRVGLRRVWLQPSIPAEPRSFRAHTRKNAVVRQKERHVREPRRQGPRIRRRDLRRARGRDTSRRPRQALLPPRRSSRATILRRQRATPRCSCWNEVPRFTASRPCERFCRGGRASRGGSTLTTCRRDDPRRSASASGACRGERGLSQRELSEPGLSYTYLSRIEVGQRVPSEKALRKLAAKLGVTPLYLEVGRDDATCPHCGRAP
jgi:hypothetical protein